MTTDIPVVLSILLVSLFAACVRALVLAPAKPRKLGAERREHE